jgi:hypothetical protein
MLECIIAIKVNYAKKDFNKGEIIIDKPAKGEVELRVRLDADKETIFLT